MLQHGAKPHIAFHRKHGGGGVTGVANDDGFYAIVPSRPVDGAVFPGSQIIARLSAGGVKGL